MGFSELALYWAERGYRVLPLRPLDQKGGGKVGYRRWQHHATTDPEGIAALAKRYGEDCGVGICTTGLLAVDVDGDAGHAVMEDFERRGYSFPKTMIFRSPADPLHYKLIYRAPEGVEFKQTCGWKADGTNPTRIDIKAWRCLVVAGGSIHHSGQPTITENELPLSALPEAPAWLVQLLASQGRVKTQAELDAAAKATAGKHTEWHANEFTLKPYIEMAIAKFPTAIGRRHEPTRDLIGKLCCSRLTDDQILDVGKSWLRHYEGRYGLTFEQALAQFQAILASTRANPDFVPYTFNILDVELPPQFLSILAKLEKIEGKPSRILVEVVLREWLLDVQKIVTKPTHHFTLSGVEVGNDIVSLLLQTPIQMTWKGVKEGYRLLAKTGIDDHKFLDLKSKFFSLPDWGTNGTKAKKLELFIRIAKGVPRKPSVYDPSPWLRERLSGEKAPEQVEAVETQAEPQETAEAEEIRQALAASKSGYYKTPYYKKFVKAIKDRDRCTCQACGKQYDESNMRTVCIGGDFGRIRDPANFACACKKCATLHGTISRADDFSKYDDKRTKQVIEAWYPEFKELQNDRNAVRC